jgi:hypothetical protein
VQPQQQQRQQQQQQQQQRECKLRFGNAQQEAEKSKPPTLSMKLHSGSAAPCMGDQQTRFLQRTRPGEEGWRVRRW